MKPGVYVPEVYWEYEYIEGIKINNHNELKTDGYDLVRWCSTTVFFIIRPWYIRKDRKGKLFEKGAVGEVELSKVVNDTLILYFSKHLPLRGEKGI